MKKFLKVLVTLSVIAALLLCFAGCKKDEKEEAKPEDKKVSSTEAAEETVTKFMDAICEGNFKEAFTYADDEIDFKDTMFEEAADAECESREDLINLKMKDMPSEFEDYGLEDQFRDVVEKTIKIQLDGMNYEIAESEEKDGVCAVKATFEYYDTDEREEITDKCDEDLASIQQELNASYQSGDYTLDEANEIFYEYFIESMDNMADEMKDCDTEEITLEFSVYEEDGKWIISADDSDLSELEDIHLS